MSARSSNKSLSPWDEIVKAEKLHTLEQHEMTIDTYAQVASIPRNTAARRLESLVRQRTADVTKKRMLVGGRVQYVNVYSIRQ